MQIAMAIAKEDAAGRNYLTWAPVQGTVRLLDVDPGDRVDPVSVTLSNDNPDVGGQLEFAATRDQVRAPSLDLVLPPDGSPVEFWVAGVVGKPSSADEDAVIRVAEAGAVEALVSKPVMVRIRKNANQLSPAERDRFTTTLAKLNDQGAGLFKDFREMHKEQLALRQAHGRPGFLSWHRAYLLDLERELQRIDPTVTLPYWRFHDPAPNVFSPELMGRTGALDNVIFSATNLLRQWQTEGPPGITRRPFFNSQTAGAFVSSEAFTLALGGPPPNATFDTGSTTPAGGFDEMEGDPHGLAHTSFTFSSWISAPPRHPAILCSSSCTVTSTGCGRSGSGPTTASTARRRIPTSSVATPVRPPPPLSDTTSWTPCGPGTTSPALRGHRTRLGPRSLRRRRPPPRALPRRLET
jgi:tyrosinase